MITTSSAVLDKIQASTLTALGRIFDRTAQLISDSMAHNKAAFTIAEDTPAKPALAVAGDEDEDKEKALDYVAEKAKPQTPEPEKPGKLSGFNQKILAEYQNQLPAMKSAASIELRQAYSQISNRQSRKLGSAASDSLQLVSYDEMEMQIILSHFETILVRHFHAPLALLNMRFDHICKRELPLNQLPLSPAMLGHILSTAVKPLELDLNDKKNLLMALLTTLKSMYRSLLEQTNILFVQNNILPDLKEQDTAVQQKRESQRKQAEEKRKALLGISGDGQNSLTSPSEQVSQFLQRLNIPDDAQQHVITTKKGAPLLDRQQLASKVALINEAPVTEDNGIYRKVQTEQTLAQQLTNKAQLENYGLSEQAAKTISLMSMVFEDLLGNKNVPDAIKALLAQLQAPLLKAAVQDEMFLGDTENPAQKLFNSITEASLSWSPESNPENDFLYKKMSTIVDKVSNDFDDDYLIFDEAIADFFTFREDEQQKTAQVEGRIIDKETAQARLKAARSIAERHIQKKFGALNLPDSIHEFVNTVWKQLLFFIYNKEHSKESSEWQDAIEIENSLLINLSRKEHDDVEVFLIVLEEKLHDCGIPAAEAEKHVNAIKAELATDHSEALAGLVIDDSEEEPDNSAEQKADDALLQDVIVGSWLQKNDQTPPLKIKVAAYIRFNDSYVMVLRNGMKENTYTRQQLVDNIKSKAIEILKNDLLFESALENVISGIR